MPHPLSTELPLFIPNLIPLSFSVLTFYLLGSAYVNYLWFASRTIVAGSLPFPLVQVGPVPFLELLLINVIGQADLTL